MNNMKNLIAAILLPAALCTTYNAVAQKKSDKKIVKQLKKDIGYLASDELKGRRTGSAGEKAAADYIISYYEKEGVSAYKSKYTYPFTFVNGRQIGAGTRIQLGGNELTEEYAFPLPFSADGNITGEVIPDVFEQDNVWMISLYENADEAKNPHFDWEKAAFKKVLDAAKHGAKGVLLYDKYGAKYEPQFNKKSSFENLDLPSAFLNNKGYKTYASASDGLLVNMNIIIEKTNLTGNNIAGYVDNGAKYTVVLGAHYDHLGMGEDGNSRYTGKEPQIHNGADDNASGTAALMQLASWIQNSSFKKYNYLFVHFSAEELGLIGSKAFVKDMSLDSSSIAYMINMDMVGRLNDSTHALTVGGVGTAKVWGSVISNDNFKVSIDSSGVGPSDHSSFYHQGIPVLFFFTGTHTDYHKPEDDADKINYKGEAAIIKYVYNVVDRMEDKPRPEFTPTKQKDIGKVRFKVTLGIMPDYAFQGEGVRVDGVTEERPAQVAGVKGGDIITAIGDLEIKGMQTYMEALAAFNVGDVTTVTIKREGKEMTMPLTFTPKKKKH